MGDIISFSSKGHYEKTSKWLNSLGHMLMVDALLKECGERGVRALSANSPVDTGKLASSWSYKITRKKGSISIGWYTDDLTEKDNIPVAILVQYGHVGKDGSYVEGKDFINTVMQPLFQEMADRIWKEVSNP